MAEARATAEASSVVRILNDTAMDPSTKRFTKGRGARIERWLQLEQLAHSQVNGLQALAKAAPKRAAKSRVIAHEPDSIPPAEQAAAAELRCEADR